MKSMSFTVFSYNPTVLFIQPNPPNPSHVLENATQPNPTHGWTQPMSISVSLTSCTISEVFLFSSLSLPAILFSGC